MLKLWHLASLDAPTVAVVWASGFAWGAHVRLPAWVLALLALVVWAVYIGDRLLDARAGLRTPSRHLLRERHSFHWRHRYILAPIAAACAVAAFVLVCSRIHAAALREDSVVAAATVAYFSFVHAPIRVPRLVSREVLVGLLFTAGCILPTLTAVPAAPLRLLATPACFFAALAWLNVRAISRWEASSRAGSTGIAPLAAGMGLAALLAAACAQSRSAALLLAAAGAAFLLALLDRCRPRLSPLALRAAADVALLTPILLAPASLLLR